MTAHLVSLYRAVQGVHDARRQIERDALEGIEGTAWTRGALRLERRLVRCGIPRARLERVEGMEREMMVMPLTCGSRACEPCGRILRERARVRMEAGPMRPDGSPIAWRSVVTLTMRPEVDGQRAWESMSGWVSRWLAAWKRALAREGYDDRVSYAWVIEPTRRGWPHVHILTTVPHRGYDVEERMRIWAVEMWEKITTCYVSRATEVKRDGLPHGIGCDWQPIKSRAAAAKYLSMYLSKARLDIWHYAVLGRKRVWSTSRDIPASREDSTGWRLERVISPWDDPARSPDAAAELLDAGWIERWTMEDGPSMWVRPEWDALREDTWRVGWLAEVWRRSTDPCPVG